MTELTEAQSGPCRFALVASVLLLLCGCQGAGETTDRLVPRGFRGNPWGPQANAMRERGEIPVVPNNPDMAAWDTWGKANLREGDILLRMGDARAALGLLPFSKFSAAIAGSRFSHSGIVAREGGEVVVYDTTTTGPQRQPLAIWLLDTRGSFAVKRPKPEYQAQVPRAVAFCRAAYEKQTPFDFGMKLGDDHLYCIELTERAYQTSGLPLSKALRLDELPRYGEFPKFVRLLKLATPMVPEQRAYVIGNEKIGIWSSPALETVYDAPNGRPPVEAVPMLAGRPANGSSRR
jgi:Permuted papain-like amidase enzyme, YaeF/YiiX, C92 family